MKPEEAMQAYITRLQSIVRELRSVGETVNDSRIVDRLIAGLPQQYDNLK